MSRHSSIKSLLISSEDFETEKQVKNEKTISESMSFFIFFISNCLYGISNFHVKYIQSVFKEEYDVFSFALWRSLSLTIIVYSLMIYKEIEIKDFRKLNKNGKFWLGVRSIGQFLSLIFFIFTLEKLRVSTTNCFIAMNPAAILVMSWLLLKEKFYWRYPIGIVICFLGVLMIISNEGGSNLIDDSQLTYLDVIIGSFWGVVNLITVAILYVSSKILHTENIEQENQSFYIGFSNFLCSLFAITIFTGRLYFDVTFIFSCVFNSIFFLLATFLSIIAVKNVDLNKTTPLNYFMIIVSTFLSIIFLNEPLFFTDVLGSFIILGYNIYNSLYPIIDK